MPRVLGVDPGTISIDVCGMANADVFLDRALPTADVMNQPDTLVEIIESAAPLDAVVGPSGYGLPLTTAQQATDRDIRLAHLGAAGEAGGLGGFGRLLRALGQCSVPITLVPGVIHLPTVPAYRKVNRVDMGTADKVCAAALAIREQAERRRCSPSAVSFVLLECGGAFTAAIAVEQGRIVDGLGGSSGPMGMQATGALDGEVAFLAGSISKDMLFHGGAATVAGVDAADLCERFSSAGPSVAERTAWDAYIEGAVKAVAALTVAVPRPAEILLSGRMARSEAVRAELASRLSHVLAGVPFHVLQGFARVSKHAAQGAAIIADGLAGGSAAELVETLQLRQSSGTVLDHLFVVSPDAARRRIGLA